MTEKHRAVIQVSEELIREALAMPDGAEIVDIRRSNERFGQYEMLVDHPDLPAVAELGIIPLVTPTLTADFEKRPATWLTWDWDLPG